LQQLGELRGELKSVNGRIGGLDSKFQGRFEALEGKIQGLEDKMDGQFATVHSEMRRLDGKIGSLDKRIDVSERLAVVEGRYASSSRRA
jgi:hypothetical protein